MGCCFFVGGLRRDEQEFDEVVSEVGNGLLLVAGFGLLIPSAFYASLSRSQGNFDAAYDALLRDDTLHISRVTSVILLIAFFMYVVPQRIGLQNEANSKKLRLVPDEDPSVSRFASNADS